MTKYTETVLCVDDDTAALGSVRRALRGICSVVPATSGEDALRLIAEHGTFSVIISDMMMPKMDGISFLALARKASPSSSRIMLTGDSDQRTAVEALNKGDILRFLNKPVANEDLAKAVVAGIKQYRLHTAEKYLLQRTVKGSVLALVDTLSLANPRAFRLSGRLRDITNQLGRVLELEPRWVLDIAALLAPIGCVTLADDGWVDSKGKITRANMESMASAWRVSSQIVSKIPRLEKVARVIERAACVEALLSETQGGSSWRLAFALSVANRYGLLRRAGNTKAEAIAVLAETKNPWEASCVVALGEIELAEDRLMAESVAVSLVEEGMILGEDVFTTDGLMLAPCDMRVSPSILSKIANFMKEGRLSPEIRILRPAREVVQS